MLVTVLIAVAVVVFSAYRQVAQSAFTARQLVVFPAVLVVAGSRYLNVNPGGAGDAYIVIRALVGLAFGLLRAAAAGGWMLCLGMTERRRTCAIATALGATRGQRRGLVIAEAAVLTAEGVATGAAVGWLLSQVLVKVLTGVFDPPPEALTVPWVYLAGLLLAAAVSTIVAVAIAARATRASVVAALREL